MPHARCLFLGVGRTEIAGRSEALRRRERRGILKALLLTLAAFCDCGAAEREIPSRIDLAKPPVANQGTLVLWRFGEGGAATLKSFAPLLGGGNRSRSARRGLRRPA